MFILNPVDAENSGDVVIDILPLFFTKAILLFDTSATNSFIFANYATLCKLEVKLLGYYLIVSISIRSSIM